MSRDRREPAPPPDDTSRVPTRIAPDPGSPGPDSPAGGVGPGDHPATGAAAVGSALVLGDNLEVLRGLPGLAGQFRLAYLDPPYATGSTFRTRVPIGTEPEPASLRERALGAAVAYQDRFPGGVAELVALVRPRLEAVVKTLAPGGSVIIHADVHAGPALKLLADEVLGADRLRNTIVWHYYNKIHDRRKRALPSACDLLYWYALPPDDAVVYHALEEPRDVPVRQLVRRKLGGRMVNARGADGRVLYRERTTRGLDNVWRIPGVQPAARDEFVHFETQKPLRLLRRLVEMTTDPGDLVLDPFLGSGTAAVAAAELGRFVVGIDERPLGLHLARKRILASGAVGAGTSGAPWPLEVRSAPGPGAAPAGRVVRVADGGAPAIRWEDFRSPALEAAVALPGGALASWDDALDYWAVDWAFDGEVFRDRWRAFRTRRARSLPLSVQLPEGVDPVRVRVVGIDPVGHATPLLRVV